MNVADSWEAALMSDGPTGVHRVTCVADSTRDLSDCDCSADGTGHPDLVDSAGSIWTWWKGDLYRNGTRAIPGEWVSSLPPASQREHQSTDFGA